MASVENQRRSVVQNIGLLLGVVCAMLLYFSAPIDPTNPLLNKMAAVAVLMAFWWMTEAIPLAATALVPAALYPLFAIPPYAEIARAYTHPLIFLFLGGFLLAIAVEETGVHRRAALAVLSIVGNRPRRIIFGFMLVTFVSSMWISNTATTLMMIPIAVSMVLQVEDSNWDAKSQKNFQLALLLGVAYSASIGGMATFIGTPTNGIFKYFYEASAPSEKHVSFLEWLMLALPVAVVMVSSTWALLVYIIFPVGSKRILGEKNVLGTLKASLGKMTSAEKRIAIIFILTAILWITRRPIPNWGWAHLLGLDPIEIDGKSQKIVRDSTVAIFMALLCFIIPSGNKNGRPLLTWNMTTRLPWGILLMFGGGFALGSGMKSTGLDVYIGTKLAASAAGMSSTATQVLTTSGMTFFTELTSNMASANMLLPVLEKSAKELGLDPFFLMFPATLAASLAFMLPISTAPNAIAFGTGRIKISQMVKAGFLLNLLGILLITLWMLIVVKIRGT